MENPKDIQYFRSIKQGLPWRKSRAFPYRILIIFHHCCEKIQRPKCMMHVVASCMLLLNTNNHAYETYALRLHTCWYWAAVENYSICCGHNLDYYHLVHREFLTLEKKLTFLWEMIRPAMAMAVVVRPLPVRHWNKRAGPSSLVFLWCYRWIVGHCMVQVSYLFKWGSTFKTHEKDFGKQLISNTLML